MCLLNYNPWFNQGLQVGVKKQGMSQDSTTTETGVNPFYQFDSHLKILTDKYKYDPLLRVLLLEEKIPEDYPHEQLLSNYFASFPYEFRVEDFDTVVSGKKQQIHVLKFDRRPRTFFNLFRFLEFFRSRTKTLMMVYERYSDRYFLLKDNIDNINPVKNLLIGYRWSQEDFNQKETIFECTNLHRSRLKDQSQEMADILMVAEPMITLWSYFIKNLFLEARTYINNNMLEANRTGRTYLSKPTSAFNLMHSYSVKDLDSALETYSEAMDQAHSLIGILIQISKLQKSEKKNPNGG